MCFFFQAEDGIRDLVRSRGLGDVYKRQAVVPGGLEEGVEQLEGSREAHAFGALDGEFGHGAVSYTHLTLPTIYSV